MASELESHDRLLVKQERLARELELCRQIQNEMLPHGPLKLGLAEIAGVSIPAREVGRRLLQLLPAGGRPDRGARRGRVGQGRRRRAADGQHPGHAAGEAATRIRPRAPGRQRRPRHRGQHAARGLHHPVCRAARPAATRTALRERGAQPAVPAAGGRRNRAARFNGPADRACCRAAASRSAPSRSSPATCCSSTRTAPSRRRTRAATSSTPTGSSRRSWPRRRTGSTRSS